MEHQAEAKAMGPEHLFIEVEGRPWRAGDLAEGDVGRYLADVHAPVDLGAGPDDLVPVEERIGSRHFTVTANIDAEGGTQLRHESKGGAVMLADVARQGQDAAAGNLVAGFRREQR